MGVEGEEEKEKAMLVHCPEKKVSKISYEEQKKKNLCPQLMNCGTMLSSSSQESSIHIS